MILVIINTVINSNKIKVGKCKCLRSFRKMKSNFQRSMKIQRKILLMILRAQKKKKLNRKAIMNDEEYSVDDSQEFFFP